VSSYFEGGHNGKRESDEKKVHEINKKRYEQLNHDTGSSETDTTTTSGDLQPTKESRPAIENMSKPEMDFEFFLDNVVDLDEIFGTSANSESGNEGNSDDEDEDEDENQANLPMRIHSNYFLCALF
jgi:hypothetical protein